MGPQAVSSLGLTLAGEGVKDPELPWALDTAGQGDWTPRGPEPQPASQGRNEDADLGQRLHLGGMAQA